MVTSNRGYKNKEKSNKFTKQVAVAPNSLLTGSPEAVFRNKTHGDVEAVIFSCFFQHVLNLAGEETKIGAAAE